MLFQIINRAIARVHCSKVNINCMLEIDLCAFKNSSPSSLLSSQYRWFWWPFQQQQQSTKIRHTLSFIHAHHMPTMTMTTIELTTLTSSFESEKELNDGMVYNEIHYERKKIRSLRNHHIDFILLIIVIVIIVFVNLLTKPLYSSALW